MEVPQPVLTRSNLAIAATVLAAVAAIIAAQDGDGDIVPFFVGLTVAGGIGAWAVREPYSGRRQLLGRLIGGLWLIAAGWIGALLLMYQVTCGCSMPVVPPEETYVGLTATVYHLAGVYLGGALMAVAAFSRRLAPV
jgi:hypothetical protein